MANLELTPFTAPRSVAVIGASRDPGKLGHDVLNNIMRYGYPGKIFPVNPKADEVLGLSCYPSVLGIPDPVDLAVIVIPARFVAGALRECGDKGVKGSIVISAGFRETGAEGMRLEREIVEVAEKYGINLVGPNCLGIIDTILPLNASFAAGMPDRGRIAFMSQSGALCTAILDMALSDGTGFSRFVSLGNKADLNELDFLKAWADDAETKVITAYLEGIEDGAAFIETARHVTKRKPIIAIKSGTTDAGARAVSSHTGTLAGSEQAYKSAFRQAGILRAYSVEGLLDMAVAFARQPLPPNKQVAVVTNAGGPGIMATDALGQAGLELASLTSETHTHLRENLPPAASPLNPIDVLGDALADRYAVATRAALADPNVGSVLVVLTPQVMTQIEETARLVGEIAGGQQEKPVLACFMGEATIGEGVRILTKHRIPNYRVPERAVAALGALVRQHQWQERPLHEIERFDVDKAKVRQIFEQVRSEGRNSIGDAEARDVLQAYDIRVPRSELAETADEAIAFAEEIGYPVALKIASPDILHKTDIGGVKLNVGSATDVRDAFDLIIFRAQRHMPDAVIWGCQVQEMVRGGRETIVGMSRDPQFGPLLLFGLGGIYVEAIKDVVFRIAPISRVEAMEMIQEIRAYSLLRGVRGEASADMDAIIEAILRIAQLVTDFPEIVELDINPLLAFEEGRGVMGLDMRLILEA